MNTKTENNNSAKNRVFLNNLAALCSRRNVDMKEAFKAAGLNSDYIEDLKNDGDVTCEILVMLSFYFHIPVDYFFELSINQ